MCGSFFLAGAWHKSLFKLENAPEQNRRVPLLDCGWTVAISGRYVVWFRELSEGACESWISRSAKGLHCRLAWLARAQIVRELYLRACLNSSRLGAAPILGRIPEIKGPGLQLEWCIGIPVFHGMEIWNSYECCLVKTITANNSLKKYCHQVWHVASNDPQALNPHDGNADDPVNRGTAWYGSFFSYLSILDQNLELSYSPAETDDARS